MNLPRILTIMGSGETAPTMVKTHRSVIERLAGSARAVVLDTPYGFQENAPELAARAQPDGQTLLITTGTHAVNATLVKKLPFDPIKSLSTIRCDLTTRVCLRVVSTPRKAQLALTHPASSHARSEGVDASGSILRGDL